MASVKRRRRLGDLYVRGKEFTVDDGTGDPVTVWLQKLNELERDAVLRRASACKARYLLDAEQEETELFVGTMSSVREYVDRPGMIDIVIGEDLVKAQQRIEAQITHDENGWGKDNKIGDLIDAWTGSDDTPGFAAAFAEDENDPEALRIKGEVEAFEADVARAVEEERQRLIADCEDKPENELSRLAAHQILKRRADEEFMKEWNRQQIFYAIRELDDHHKRYFGTLQEVDDLHDYVREMLERQCSLLFVEASEGKDSPLVTNSSTSSEPTDEATPVDSGLVGAST
jgi:hypothetical protein